MTTPILVMIVGEFWHLSMPSFGISEPLSLVHYCPLTDGSSPRGQ